MVLTFLLVGAIDLTVGSLLVDRLRFWFPQWLDADWASRADPWVVYSQSYMAGILFVPFVAWALWREVVAPSATPWLRRLFWPSAGVLVTFLVVWKGGLMRQYAKEREALAWVALTAILYGAVTFAGELPGRAGRWTNRGLLGAVAAGVGGFFLVMAVLDPLLQIGWQGLSWSNGLSVEVAFFVPTGLALVVLARSLRRREEA
jgi:hypothetical protein